MRTVDGEPHREDGRPPAFHHNQIILYGELGGYETLRNFLRDTLSGTRFDLDTNSVHDSLHAGFTSALSTAAMEKGILDAPEPEQCVPFEPVQCTNLKERVYNEARWASLFSEL